MRAVFDKNAPIIEKRIKGILNPWLTPDIKALMNSRDQAKRRARSSKLENDWLTYKALRNQCTNKVKSCKASNYKNLLNDSSNKPRCFWKIVKKIFPTKMKATPTCSQFVNIKHTD